MRDVIRNRLAPGWIAYAVACLSALALQPATNMQRLLGVDASLFAYGGKLILRGLVPYRDFWDHKAPGVFYIEAAAYGLMGDSWWAPTLMQALFNVITAAVVVRASVWLLTSTTARLAFCVSAILALNHFGNADDSNLTETYQTLPLMGAILLLRPFGPRPSFTRVATAGATLALAFLIRPTALCAAIFAACVFASRDRSPAYRLRAFAREASAFAAGFGATVLIVTAYFAYHGAAGELWFASVGYNLSIYPDINPSTKTGILGRMFMFRSLHLLWPLYAMFAAAGVLYAATFGALGRVRAVERRLAAALLWALADLGAALVTRRNYGHYTIALVPSAAFAGAMLVEVAALRDRRVAWTALSLGAVMLSLCWLPQTPMLARLWRQGVRVASSPCPTIDESIARALAPVVEGRRMLTWGVPHEVAAMLSALPATPLVTTLHLRSDYGRERWAGNIVRALSDPDLAAVISSDVALETLRTEPLKRSQTPLGPTMRKVADLLDAHFERMAWTFDTPLVYVRREFLGSVADALMLPDSCRGYTDKPINWYSHGRPKRKKPTRRKKI